MMMMTTLIDKKNDCHNTLIKALTDFVRLYGEEFGKYHLDEFGLDVEEDQIQHVTKVIDLYDNGGCYFAEQTAVNQDDLTTRDFLHHAFQCLYIVRNDNGEEELKYYDLWNDGIEFDEVMSEPDHDTVASLTIETICRIYEAICLIWGRK